MAKMKRIETRRKTRSGSEVDPALVGALAAEAERGYDLARAKRRRVGRPSLGTRGASPRLSFRATPELYRAAKRRARKEGRAVSELARDAVARYVRSS